MNENWYRGGSEVEEIISTSDIKESSRMWKLVSQFVETKHSEKLIREKETNPLGQVFFLF